MYSYTPLLRVTPALHRCRWSTPRPGPVYPLERPGTYYRRGPIVGLDGSTHRDSIPSLPVRNRSLYRLSYPDPLRSGKRLLLVLLLIYIHTHKKIKQTHYRPGQALRFSGV